MSHEPMTGGRGTLQTETAAKARKAQDVAGIKATFQHVRTTASDLLNQHKFKNQRYLDNIYEPQVEVAP